MQFAPLPAHQLLSPNEHVCPNASLCVRPGHIALPHPDSHLFTKSGMLRELRELTPSTPASAYVTTLRAVVGTVDNSSKTLCVILFWWPSRRLPTVIDAAEKIVSPFLMIVAQR
jgi:hypothetical protein